MKGIKLCSYDKKRKYKPRQVIAYKNVNRKMLISNNYWAETSTYRGKS
jgi:hypothetical protein